MRREAEEDWRRWTSAVSRWKTEQYSGLFPKVRQRGDSIAARPWRWLSECRRTPITSLPMALLRRRLCGADTGGVYRELHPC